MKLDGTYTGTVLFVADCALAQTSTSVADLVPCQSGASLTSITSEENFSDGGGAFKT